MSMSISRASTLNHQAVSRIEKAFHSGQCAPEAFLDIEGAFGFYWYNQNRSSITCSRSSPHGMDFKHAQEAQLEINVFTVHGGVVMENPQGWVLSPSLWNLLTKFKLARLRVDGPSVESNKYQRNERMYCAFYFNHMG